MSPKRVARIFDTAGQMLDGAGGGYAQGYKSCTGGGVVVEFGWSFAKRRLVLAAKERTRHRVVNCVSHDEWRKVWIRQDGTGSGPGTGGTRKRIHGVFGIKGRVVNRFNTGPQQRWEIRKYDRCGSARTRTVEYTSHRKGPWHSYWGDPQPVEAPAVILAAVAGRTSAGRPPEHADEGVDEQVAHGLELEGGVVDPRLTRVPQHHDPGAHGQS